MSGWCPSLLGVWNGGGVCCCWSGPVRVARALPIPVRYSSVLQSCRVLCAAGCVVCGWWMCVCGVRVVGYPLCAPPSQWWWVGPSWMVGCVADGGWHSSGRAVLSMATPSVITDLPVCVLVSPLLVCVVVPLNGGGGVVCCPRVRIGSSLSHCSCLPCIVSLFSVFAVTALLV